MGLPEPSQRIVVDGEPQDLGPRLVRPVGKSIRFVAPCIDTGPEVCTSISRRPRLPSIRKSGRILWSLDSEEVRLSTVVYEYRCGAGYHIVRVASLRWTGSVHGADHAIDVRCWRCA